MTTESDNLVKTTSDNRITTLSAWAGALTIGHPVSVVQRALATELGVSQQAVQKGLRALAERGVVKVVARSSGTVVTRLT